ncbi:DEAD/DEAH box helicase [Pediococcus pentosaceus]|uniref:UvrD-helicase domain-containing protein n=1 Tax=Pediococcus pentosaceus TaxID=1255 RepID=UPI001962E902|nr:DEAD/DEAH box helicase [Pediococcus pentosaceus]
MNEDKNFFSNSNEQLRNLDEYKQVCNFLEIYSEKHHVPVYLLYSPLNMESKDVQYDYQFGSVILIPEKKIMFVDFKKENTESFNEYIADFKEDIANLLSNFEFTSKVGRPRKWIDKISGDIEIDSLENENFERIIKINDGEDSRRQQVVLSLLIGSINDANSFVLEKPTNMLDKVKEQIMIFDSEQTSFMFSEKEKKRLTIQGLAGTGKTELLLHKIVNLYRKEDTKIVFTFYNKILEQEMKKRIISFFNFMKVKEQIKWNERLWVMRGWGSQSDKNTGVYTYICNNYGIKFQRYNWSKTFDDICKEAISELNELDDIKPCFDYTLIDESQDFPESFFKLCEMVTKRQVIVAGDIFQNIFSNLDLDDKHPDYSLSRVYRTDPRTFSFAQLLGFGLQESTAIRWLNVEEWKSCGYKVQNENDNSYTLSRVPIKRFSETNPVKNSTTIELFEEDKIGFTVIERIKKLKDDNPTLQPGDIGIVFFSSNNNTAINHANSVSVKIEMELGMQSVKGYNTEEKNPDKIFISNQNNIKGLEFPFVIAVIVSPIDSVSKNGESIRIRNSLYMMLTRSFISSHLLFLNNEANKVIVRSYENDLEKLNKTGKINVKKPVDVIDEDILERLSKAENMSPDQIIERVIRNVFEDEDKVLSTDQNYRIVNLLKMLRVNINDEKTVKLVIEKVKDEISGIIYG